MKGLAVGLALLANLPPSPARAGLSRQDKAWLEEVKVLILPTEREVFESLKGEQDRTEFKRIFWARRDPDLSTSVNEFQVGFAERRALADKRFYTGLVRRVPRSGDVALTRTPRQSMEQIETRILRDFAERDAVPGSETDCGRVFIALGEPDNIRKLNLTVWGSREPQEWTYTALDSRFQFDESCSLPAYAQGLRLDLAESLVMQPSIDYHVEGGHIVRPLESMLPGSSPVLQLIREGRRDFELAAQSSFLKISDGATGVFGLVRGDASGLAFEDEKDGRRARVSLRVQLQREGGGTIIAPEQEELVRVESDGSFLASFRFGVRPGEYRMSVGVLERLSGKGSVLTLPLQAPDFATGELSIGSLLPLEDVKPAVADPKHPLSGFVIGDQLFVPRFGNAFRRSESILISYQFYDAKPDDATGKPSATAKLVIARADGMRVAEGPEEEFETPVAGSLLGPISLENYAPGQYSVRLAVTDAVARKLRTQTTTFEVLP